MGSLPSGTVGSCDFALFTEARGGQLAGQKEARYLPQRLAMCMPSVRHYEQRS